MQDFASTPSISISSRTLFDIRLIICSCGYTACTVPIPGQTMKHGVKVWRMFMMFPLCPIHGPKGRVSHENVHPFPQWWLGTCFFSLSVGIVITTDLDIFHRGRAQLLNHQPDIYIYIHIQIDHCQPSWTINNHHQPSSIIDTKTIDGPMMGLMHLGSKAHVIRVPITAKIIGAEECACLDWMSSIGRAQR